MKSTNYAGLQYWLYPVILVVVGWIFAFLMPDKLRIILVLLAAAGTIILLLCFISHRIMLARREKVFANLEFTIMLQQPFDNPESMNILDNVTWFFSIEGIKAAGWEIDKDYVHNDAKTVAFKCNRTECECKNRLGLIVRYQNQEELEEKFKNKYNGNETIKSVQEHKFMELTEKDVFNKLYTVAVMGHAESEYTYRLGSIYARHGITHIAPYATSSRLESKIQGVLLEKKIASKPYLLQLPPSNDWQAILIAMTVYKIILTISSNTKSEIAISIIWDSDNKDYSESLLDGIVRCLDWKKEKADHYSGFRGRLQVFRLNMGNIKKNKKDKRKCYDTVIISDVVVIIGMHDFASEVLSALKEKIARKKKDNKKSEKETPSYFIISDGVVSGDSLITDRDCFLPREGHAKILFTFPQTGPNYWGCPHVMPVEPDSKKEAIIREILRNYRPPKSYQEYETEPNPSELAKRFSDPNYGYYIVLGANKIAKKWHGLIKAKGLWRPATVINSARSLMRNILFEKKMDLQIDSSLLFGSLNKDDISSDFISENNKFCILYLHVTADRLLEWKQFEFSDDASIAKSDDASIAKSDDANVKKGKSKRKSATRKKQKTEHKSRKDKSKKK